MRPTGDGEWKYVQQKVNKVRVPPARSQAGKDSVDNLWEINAEAKNQKTSTAKITVPLIGGDAAAIKRLTTQESEKNLGLRVQPDGKCTAQMEVKKEQVEEWTSKVKTGQLPTREVW